MCVGGGGGGWRERKKETHRERTSYLQFIGGKYWKKNEIEKKKERDKEK